MVDDENTTEIPFTEEESQLSRDHAILRALRQIDLQISHARLEQQKSLRRDFISGWFLIVLFAGIVCCLLLVITHLIVL